MTTARAQSKAGAHADSADHPASPAYLAWLAIAVVSFAAFVVLTIAVASRVAFPFDASLLSLARSWDGQPMVWKVVSESANIPLIVIGLGLVIWLFVTGRRREAVLVFVMLAAVTAGSEGVKQLVGRDRPSGNGDGIPGVVYSYPSGHELEVVTILGIVAMRVWHATRHVLLRLIVPVLVVIEAVLVAVARMALNAHYPTDVLAGLLGGIGALSLYAWCTRPGAWADKPPAEWEEARHAPNVS